MITILTPTYNRRNTLGRLFDSLVSQRNHSFEWIIIDDGSTDGTADIVREFQDSGPPFSLRFFIQENAGKHVAVNAGVAVAEHGWIFIVDSDDLLTPDAVEVCCNAILTLPEVGLVGVCFRKAHLDGEIIGEKKFFTEEFVALHPSAAGELLKGDLAYLFTSDAMKASPFPVIKGEKFVPELYVWNMIGDMGEVFYFVNQVIYLCEYLPDGYSRNFSANLRRNSLGFKMFYWSQFFRETTLKGRVKCILRVLQCKCYSLLRSIL